MAQSRTVMTLKFLAVDLVGSFVYFPLWWYSAGMVRTGKFALRTLGNATKSFGLTVWLKNLFVPMFGQYDIQGRIISFFMRLVTIIFYSVIMMLLAVGLLLLVVAWFVFPIFVTYELMLQILGLAGIAI